MQCNAEFYFFPFEISIMSNFISITSFFHFFQSLLEEMSSRSKDKEKLAPLLADLVSQLPEERSSEKEELQNRLGGLNKKWLDLSDRLGQHKSRLDSAFDMATTHERSMGALTPWVPETLERLENLGPPPTEPEKVQKLRVEIEVSPYSLIKLMTLPALS